MSIKFKINQKSLDDLSRNTIDQLRRLTENKDLLDQIGTETVADIKGQTRRGFSIPLNTRFKALSAPWTKRRGELAEANETSDVYSQKRSNLSLSGQLVDSVSYETRKNQIAIGAKGQRRPYKYISKKTGEIKTVTSDVSNQELSEYVSKDRPFIGFRDKMRERALRIINEYLRRVLRR